MRIIYDKLLEIVYEDVDIDCILQRSIANWRSLKSSRL